MTRVQKNKGIALVEILIASAIMLIVILYTNRAYNTYLQFALNNQHTVQATYISEEGFEVISFIRNASWANNIATLSTTTTHYLYFDGSTWSSTTTPQYIDGQFLRSFTISDVYRDGNSDIATSGTYDSGTKLITQNVAYTEGHATTTKTMRMYITNIQ